jgi:hypothetical protein
MSGGWYILAGAVRILFLFAPFMSVKEEFPLTGNTLDEAQEMARAGNCRAMLVSFPAEFLLRALAEASTRCHQPDLLIVAIYFVIASALAFGLYKIPANPYFRGGRPYIWFVAFTIFGAAAQIKFLALAVGFICKE